MKRPTLSFRRFHASLSLSIVASFAIASTGWTLIAKPQSPQDRENLHSVVSRVMLTPPLRSPEVSLRYTPNGQYVLLQDPAGVVVLQRDPLRILFRISADNIYPAQFSADSRSLLLVSRGLGFAKWSLPGGEKIANGELPTKEYCADGQLSPGGQLFACLQADFHFVLFDLSTQKVVMDQSAAPAPPSGPGGLRDFYPTLHSLHLFFISLDNGSAFPSPFGLLRTGEARPNPSRSLSTSSIYFSPDAKMLIASHLNNAFAVDISAKRKFDLASAIQKALHGAVALQDGELLIAADSSKDAPQQNAVALSLRNGETLARFSLEASRLRFATNSRFLISNNISPESQNATAFDLEQKRPLETPPAVALDLHDDELAVFTVNGSLGFYRVGQRELLAHFPMPLAALPLLRSAAVSPRLDKLALSVDGVGALYDLSDGRRMATFPRFSGANFVEPDAIFLFPRFRDDSAHVARVKTATGALTPAWEAGKEQQVRSGGSALVEYSFLIERIGSPVEISAAGLQAPYELRALDPDRGAELWKRAFLNNPPTPFADPQGQRLVLGWKARTPEARSAAKHSPAAFEILKNTKLTDHDSYFEALDTRSGTPVGGVLVTVGNSPTTFDAAFSVGDAMILQKDGVRVSVYSMRDGQLKAHLVGIRPSADAENNLLALDLGEGRLGIFDLVSGSKLDEQLFADNLAYTHVSGDGKRLFVLTEHQSAVILDVGNLRKTPNSAANTKEQKQDEYGFGLSSTQKLRQLR